MPAALSIAAGAVSKQYGIAWEVALSLLLGQVSARIIHGDVGMFSLDIQDALGDAKAARGGTIGVGPPIDYAKLHTSARAKSGYAGVYANGKGFRAMAKTADGLQYIGTFKTADEAAWKRYQHYIANELPYGELEIEMDRWRNPQDPSEMPFTGTDEQLIAAIREHAERAGTTRVIFGANDENVPAKYRRGALRPKAPAAVTPYPGGNEPDFQTLMLEATSGVPKIAGFDANSLPPDVQALLDEDDE